MLVSFKAISLLMLISSIIIYEWTRRNTNLFFDGFYRFIAYCGENKASAGFLGLTSLAGLIFSVVTYRKPNDSVKKQKKAHSTGNKSHAIVGNDATINYYGTSGGMLAKLLQH